MGILGKIFGAGGEAAAKPIEAVGNIIDDIFTSKEEKLDKKALLERIAQRPSMVQTEINKIEAQHRSIFVAGWRPFIGWVCGTALGYNFILRDLIAWGLLNFADSISLPPALQMEHLMTVLMGMLGLGTLRTFEKINNKAK